MSTLTVYASATNPAPFRADDLPWSEWIDALRELVAFRATSKVALPAFAPHSLRVPYRVAANVGAVTAIAIDVDGCDLAALRVAIRARAIAAIVYGTPSDDDAIDARRVRVVSPIDRDITPEECGATRLAFASLLGLDPRACGVDKALDASRLFFVGAIDGTAPRLFEVFGGEPVAVDALLAAAPAIVAPSPIAISTPAIAIAPDAIHPSVNAAINAIVGALGDAHEHDGSKHALCGAIGGVMRRSGAFTRADCAATIERWLPRNDPSVDVRAGVSWACGAWQRDPTEVSGGAVLRGILGEDRAAVIECACALPRQARSLARGIGASDAGTARDDAIDSDGLVFGELTSNPPRQTYLVPELEIGVGRPYGWLGKSNASKTLSLQQLEVCLALGVPVFGRFDGPGHAVPVLRIAYEGFVKAAEDYARLLRGATSDVDWRALNERLRFAEGRRFLGLDSDANRDWLLRVTAPFRGGLVVIDPLVAACRGLDENSVEIASPIYDLEGVSQANGVAIIVAHHLGHAHDRSRGSSSIEGALGANAIVSKEDDPKRKNARLVRPAKMNRYGTDAFALALQDLDERGNPWTPTAETRKRGEVSYALRVTAADVPRELPKPDKHAETIASKARFLRDLLANDSAGERLRLTATQARSECGANGDAWTEIQQAAELLGVRWDRSGPKGARMLYVPRNETPRPAGYAKGAT